MTPRQHHYQFAHRALPQFGLAGVAQTLDILKTPMGGPFLIDIWDKVGQDLPKQERLPPSGLACSSHQTADGRSVIVVALPPPEEMTEAWFVAFLRVPEERRLMIFKSPATLRCFTLEKGVNLEDGAQRTVLCEWTRDGNHMNFGDGPSPTVEAFVAAIANVA